jgi:hypothetical protein
MSRIRRRKHGMARNPTQSRRIGTLYRGLACPSIFMSSLNFSQFVG